MCVWQARSRCCWTSRDWRQWWPRRSCAACGSTGSASSAFSGPASTYSSATCRTTTRSCLSTGPTPAVDRAHTEHCSRAVATGASPTAVLGRAPLLLLPTSPTTVGFSPSDARSATRRSIRSLRTHTLYACTDYNELNTRFTPASLDTCACVCVCVCESTELYSSTPVCSQWFRIGCARSMCSMCTFSSVATVTLNIRLLTVWLISRTVSTVSFLLVSQRRIREASALILPTHLLVGGSYFRAPQLS